MPRVLSAATYVRTSQTMPKKANRNNGSALRGSQLSIAQKLEARGLGIKFTRVRQNAQNPHAAPFRRPEAKEIYEDPITNFKVFPAGKKPDAEYTTFIRLHASARALVEDNMLEIEDNYGKHTLGMSSYLDKSEGEFERMEEYFLRDKLGLKPIDTSDAHCWKFVTASKGSTAPVSAEAAAPSADGLTSSQVVTAGGGTHTTWETASERGDSSAAAQIAPSSGTHKKAIQTAFYIDLQKLQKNYYMYLRASIPLFMDDDAQKVYKTILAQEDRERDLPIAEKYLPEKHISWEWIKEQIFTQMCCFTNGNYFYKTLMTLYRKNNQSRYAWCQLVLGSQREIVNYGNGYDQIGSKDAVEKLWDWLCPVNEQPVMRRYYKRVHQPMYKDTQTILTTVTLEQLVNDITVNVDKSDWPMGVSYKNAHCKAGHAKLLHSHTYVQRLRDKITELEASKRNNTKRTQNRTQTHEAPSEDEASSVMPPDMELTAFPDEDYSTSGGGGSKGQKQKRKLNRKRKRNNNKQKGKNAKTPSVELMCTHGISPHHIYAVESRLYMVWGTVVHGI